MSVPWPNASAQIATYFELAAGVLLILGLLVRIVGPLLFIQMAFAFGFAHWGKGVFVADGGWELVGVLGAAGLALAASGSGRFSLDYLFMTPVRARKNVRRRQRRRPTVAILPQPRLPERLEPRTQLRMQLRILARARTAAMGPPTRALTSRAPITRVLISRARPRRPPTTRVPTSGATTRAISPRTINPGTIEETTATLATPSVARTALAVLAALAPPVAPVRRA